MSHFSRMSNRFKNTLIAYIPFAFEAAALLAAGVRRIT
ncbi:hypothetical protein RINTU1_35800 [Candidatus Regiella insecticola]|uniref:Uncharacterized protein n=1 Tax=Candidatus Regiella insecticola TaxID=138073 RepID=A0A6L2ZSD1_9ENTR|nr:hypothetical protein RINTU1_35800 [Candidatus Regiella insecticola]